MHEVRSKHGDPSEITFSSVQLLPYLIAVIEEGLRLCPPNPSGLQHIVPPGGDTVRGHWLPGGVSLLFSAIERFWTPLIQMHIH